MISKVNVTTSPTLVAAHNPSRQWVILENQSDTDIYVAFTPDAAEVSLPAGAKPGLKVAAGETREIGLPPGDFAMRNSVRSAIYAIHGGSGDKVLVAHEG
jgi:hypothetical protein